MNESPHRLLCISGSLRAGSLCLGTCRAAVAAAALLNLDTEIIAVGELDLPMYHPDFDLDAYGSAKPRIERLLDALRTATVMIWVSPTYHGTMSGVFKNTLDFAEFLGGDTPPYLQGRAVGLVAINDSTTFAAMRDCARELRAWLAPSHLELSSKDFDAGQNLVSEKGVRRLGRIVSELADFSQRHASPSTGASLGM